MKTRRHIAFVAIAILVLVVSLVVSAMPGEALEEVASTAVQPDNLDHNPVEDENIVSDQTDRAVAERAAAASGRNAVVREPARATAGAVEKPTVNRVSSKTVVPNEAARASDEDVELLARMISAEAAGESYKGMVAVGAVIINRVQDGRFPGTIRGVLFQKGQFEPVSNGWLWRTVVSPVHRRAAREALAGADPTNGALYFFVHSRVKNKWLWARPHKITIGGHRFTA